MLIHSALTYTLSLTHTGSMQVKKVTYLSHNALSLSSLIKKWSQELCWRQSLQAALTNVLSRPYLSERWQLCHLPSPLCSLRVFTGVYLESRLMLCSQWGERKERGGGEGETDGGRETKSSRERGGRGVEWVKEKIPFLLKSRSSSGQTALPPTALLNAPHPFTLSTALWLKGKELKRDA